MSKISRTYFFETHHPMPDWMKEFADNLRKNSKPKSAVDVARERNQASILDQISMMMSKRPVHATVDSVVQELRERTGLNKYIENLSATSSNSGEMHSTAEIRDIPESLSKYICADDIVSFIDNTIANSHGLGSSVLQIQHDILHIFGKKCGLMPQDIINNEVAKYISDSILEAQLRNVRKEHNSSIGIGVGKNEPDNEEGDDFFSTLTPAAK